MVLFALAADGREHLYFAHALCGLAEFDDAVDVADDSGVFWLACFEQLGHARQTAGDVTGFRGFPAAPW